MLVDLTTQEAHDQSLLVPLSYSSQRVGDDVFSEPFWDYDAEGVPHDFGFDTDAPEVRSDEHQEGDTYQLTPSQFAETAIRIPVAGAVEKFSLAERPYLRRVYDTGWKRRLLIAGRQVEKSTTCGNIALGYTCINNAFRTLYVAPTAEQSINFSRDRIQEPIEVSPTLQAYTNTRLTNAVAHKRFINRSDIRLRYAYLTADRVRGIPADLIEVDELQDILVDNLPVIEECASHSAYKLFLYSGTPKSHDNTIEHYWANYSTQNEWVVPCTRHGTPKNPSSWHWNILNEKCIGKKGLICDHCGEPIDPYRPEATWASLNPRTDANFERVTFEGYRLPQLMVPWIIGTPDGWMDLLYKQERYSRPRFHNEVLGRSYDSGTRPLTQGQLQACCDPAVRISDYEHFKQFAHSGIGLFGGIDWGTGEQSYTVMSLGGYFGGNFTIFWVHRFTGREMEPDYQLDIIRNIIQTFGLRIVGCDYGGGFDRNKALINSFGIEKIAKYQYTNNQKKAKIYLEPALGRYMVHRSEVMTDVFNAYLRKMIRLPNWEEFHDPYGNDILNVFAEFNERTRMIEYKHSPGTTDDAFHSILYCLLASMIMHPRADIILPMEYDGTPHLPDY